MKQVYLDNAATTPTSDQVLKAMLPYFTQKYGNISEPHYLGQEARAAVEKARGILAMFLGAKNAEIIFTSSATESINLSHKGLVEALSNQKFKLHIITSQVEHSAVLETCRHLEKANLAKVTYLKVDEFGQIQTSDLIQAITPETVLVSIMYINNEVGTIQPIAQIGQLVKKINTERLISNLPHLYFHTDATQAIQYLDCNVDFLGVDLLSLTGHKFSAPKGVGVLYQRLEVPLIRQQDGGGQERGLRSGTENVPYIVGLGKAVEESTKSTLRLRSGLMVSEVEPSKVLSTKYVKGLRDKLIEGVLKIPGIKLTGHPKERAPHIASFIIEGVEGESVVLLLSEHGISASSGSACTSQRLAPSHVLEAMGIPAELSHGSLRLSLGPKNRESDILYVLKVLPKVVERLRSMAPKI